MRDSFDASPQLESREITPTLVICDATTVVS
jgi:hypothetical protein